MRGAKPKLDNVIPMKGADAAAKNQKARKERARKITNKLRPRGLSDEMKVEWNRVGLLLADPVLDRLKPHFVDVVVEYCTVMLRLRDFRRFFVDLEETRRLEKLAKAAGGNLLGDIACEHPMAAEIYEVKGRNGSQLKSHPHVAQMNEAWRQWRSLVAMLGLSPTDERNMATGQADLFDPASEFD